MSDLVRGVSLVGVGASAGADNDDDIFKNRLAQVRVSEDIVNDHGLSNKISTTKYSLLSWLPMSMAEQFRRFANIYFVIVVIMMYIGRYAPHLYSTPLLPESTAVTLVLVMMVTSIKEGLEDIQRAHFDHEENVREANVVTFDQDGNEVTTIKETQQICSGDIVKLNGLVQVPVDMVLILTSNWKEGNRCFIETANLDGETNLKVREAPAGLLPKVEAEDGKVSQALFSGSCEFENPNKNMHNFVGALHLDSLKSEFKDGVPLGSENVLLRGSLFSNTEWCYGVALYTGQDTKVQMNNTIAPTKLGKVERYANVAVLIILMAQLVLTSISVISVYAMDFQYASTLPYVNYDGDMGQSILPLWLEQWFIFFLLYVNFIPISLYVTMELTNIGQAYMMSNDLKMYDKDLDEPCRVKSSSLVQEPGIVSNIFSDKTGTLTRNEMKLVSVVIKGRRFQVPRDQTPGKLAEEDSKKIYNSLTGMAFMRALTTCHTVVRDKSGEYRAESPDEKALIEGVSPYGCSLLERGNSSMKCLIAGKEEEYQILAVNQFNSDRKRMSVLVKHVETQKIFLVCKGADSTMLQLVNADEAVIEDVQKSLLDLAHMGLRTLCVAQKELTQKQADEWLAKYSTAAASMKNRSDRMARVGGSIEQGMTLLGITAIEDRLQDEVPEVIADLAKAGITLWMLTGDKEETAVQIGRSCNLLTPDTNLLVLTKCENKEQFRLHLDEIYMLSQKMWSDSEAESPWGAQSRSSLNLGIAPERWEYIYDKVVSAVKWATRGTMNLNRQNKKYLNQSQSVALVLDGPSFEFMDFENEEERAKILAVGQVCRSVIACRLTPIQKQRLVNIVKVDSKPSATTLAIGDGANDVSMIREAHVGVGIFGKEGKQAANNADFAIGQFKFLRRLTLVHGRWNYMRQSKVFLYSMHKNICIVVTLMWYNYLAAMSGVSVYESWLYSSYNIVLGLPIIFFGFIDKDKSEEFVLDNPSMYGSGKQNIMLSKRRIFLWIANACVMGIVISLMCYVAMRNTALSYDFWAFGTFVFVALVNSMQAKVAFMHHQWNYINVFGLLISVVGTLFIVLILSTWGWEPLYMLEDIMFIGSGQWLLGQSEFWLYAFFTIPLMVLLVDYSSHSVRYMFFPTPEMVSKDMEVKNVIDEDEELFFKPVRNVTSSFSLGSSSNLSELINSESGSVETGFVNRDSFETDNDGESVPLPPPVAAAAAAAGTPKSLASTDSNDTSALGLNISDHGSSTDPNEPPPPPL